MDKLKPILDHKFWILSGLALIIPFVGWIIATKTYATGVEERETAIDGAFSSVQFAGEPPNQSWVDGAAAIVDSEQSRFHKAQRSLWESQKQSMIWPTGVHELMADVPYEGDISSTARERYRLGYYRQLSKMEKSIRAIDPLTGEGVVIVDRSVYTHIPDGTWASQPPVSSEMWNAQIDFWLVEAVLESIGSINRGAEKITEAPVRRVLELTLRGGERDYSAGGAEESGGYGGGMSEGGAYPGGGEYGGNFGAGGDGLGGAGVKTEVKFDLSEELGPVAGGASGAGGYGEMSMAGGASGDGEYGADAASGPTGPDRYVDDEEGDPFRTRAFVLGVLMDHNDLPKFMSELSRSDWPLQIIRVQMAAVNPDNLADASRSGGRPGARPGMTPGGGFGASAGGFGSPGESEGYGDSSGGFSAGGGISGRPGLSSGGLNSVANNGLIQQAMTDPNLAEVWIGGLITLFRPIEEEASEESNAETQMDVTSQPDDSLANEEAENPVADENAGTGESNGSTESVEESSGQEDTSEKETPAPETSTPETENNAESPPEATTPTPDPTES